MAKPLIAIVDDDPSLRKLLEYQFSKKLDYDVLIFEDGVSFLEDTSDHPDLVILDVMMPRMSGTEVLKTFRGREPDVPVIILSAQASIEGAIELLKLGATDYLVKPVDLQKLEIATRNAIQLRNLNKELRGLRDRISASVQLPNLISGDGEMQSIFQLVGKVKDSDIAVLVMGESGTGKELISSAIHFTGKRKDGPFIVVNCASIPPDLLESELFGHEKGAFTGALQRKVGRFEAADGGTIFLDEIGELDLSLQSKLLRVLQNKTFERVGGTTSITSDVRVVSATNRDLRAEAREGRFREDLYYRLATFPMVLPPLRQRRSDILLLAEHFLKKYAAEERKNVNAFSRPALQLMYGYPWPGNVRELENAIQRGVVLVEGKTFTENELPVVVRSFSDPETLQEADALSAPSIGQAEIIPMEKLKEMAVRNALTVTGGNSMRAAKKLNIGRATLYRLMKKYGLSGMEKTAS
jgi:DNA-binding NtrC family response regulator